MCVYIIIIIIIVIYLCESLSLVRCGWLAANKAIRRDFDDRLLVYLNNISSVFSHNRRHFNSNGLEIMSHQPGRGTSSSSATHSRCVLYMYEIPGMMIIMSFYCTFLTEAGQDDCFFLVISLPLSLKIRIHEFLISSLPYITF